ncbi:hypothetical protein F503_01414 [Ophiostoma piceae UAMH 11346]|uniref:Aminoglycoside phosphotransferase domain-containing protein n=1 Tax=Ophiostoma piceae (strain UAMH 11346) TaxID=1262450 RepID=S3CUK9_OPHP1|nr:hypothetical protein F503_01414 [Ophiostoma piceae UAMH 11346]
MPLWTCSITDCHRPAIRNTGDCVICDQHLCSVHIQEPSHSCPVWNDGDVYDEIAAKAEQKEMQDLLSRINTKALAARASALRGGKACTVPPLSYNKEKRSAVMGGMNYHFEVTFDDGVVWIARIRRHNVTSPPRAVGNYIVQSEVTTLRYLADTVPSARTPRVFDFALQDSTNPVGVGYILMEKLPGTSLRWSVATDIQRRRVMDQLADVFIELSQHSFLSMGSLSLSKDGKAEVGPVAREAFMDMHGDMLCHSGPFTSILDYYQQDIRLVLIRILHSELYAPKPVDAYLAHLYLRDVAPSVLPKEDIYYLKHADDKGDHLLVDADYNLTGIIDWEWAHTAPASIAFNSPIGFLPVGDFYDGANDIGADESVFAQLLADKGRDDLAQCVRTGRLQHRFAFCCGYDMDTDWEGFLGLFRGLREAVQIDAGIDWDEWKAKALDKYRDDDGLKQLLERQQTVRK